MASIDSKVKQKVDKLIEDMDLTGYPTDVEKVAVVHSVTTIAYPFGEEISGVLVFKEGKASIGYNASESKVRRRFSIAHELGHYFLHVGNKEAVFMDKPLYRKNIGNYQSSEEEIQEIEANYFAASLLMPKKILQQVVSALDLSLDDEMNIKILAKKFEVSISAMTFRLINLGLYRM